VWSEGRGTPEESVGLGCGGRTRQPLASLPAEFSTHNPAPYTRRNPQRFPPTFLRMSGIEKVWKGRVTSCVRDDAPRRVRCPENFALRDHTNEILVALQSNRHAKGQDAFSRCASFHAAHLWQTH